MPESHLSLQLLLSLLLYMFMATGIEYLHRYLIRHAHSQTQLWIWGHFYMPFLHAIMVIAFLLASYPILFSLPDSPELLNILFNGTGHIGYLTGVVFLLSIVIPLLPLKFLSLFILPLQGILASALLFHWMVEAMNISDYTLIPDLSTMIMIVTLSISAWWISGYSSSYPGDIFEQVFEVSESEVLFKEGVLLLLQLPAILIYTLYLGNQFLTL